MKSLTLIITLLIAPLFSINTSNTHEYYISVTKVEYSNEQSSLQIISQIFIDDFEKLLRQRYDESITLTESNEPKIIEDYMKRYLQNKLMINVNGSKVNFNFLGKEYKDDIVYCYLEIENITEINSIKITNRVLFDVISEQQNIVRLKLKNKNKSFLLTPENDNCMLNFN
ncbi:DUF6702 family protein [Winogradskyella sp. UBA3174]|uniref:DUF6702 family protein n=1 Tax=Winogradskyella sp. UBA3174 TaxID=1947785 RepID=UPI0025D3C285|nr:DUF6702 family protein [Winogradskyella sp. UBA3174]|tara:strand:+ start:25817 stop:26326 length:510 start_codon:yes stop_codon:yes gene_type:complete